MGLQRVAEAPTLRAMSALVYRIVSRKSDIYSELRGNVITHDH